VSYITARVIKINTYIGRITLGIFNLLALRKVRSVIEARFGKLTSQCFAVLYLVQFHSLFYLTRPLPNTFALIFCNLAFAYWLQGLWGPCIGFLAFSTIVFRQEVFILAFSVSYWALIFASSWWFLTSFQAS
jgi:alpha-1,6-mannosyltransferase